MVLTRLHLDFWALEQEPVRIPLLVKEVVWSCCIALANWLSVKFKLLFIGSIKS